MLVWITDKEGVLSAPHVRSLIEVALDVGLEALGVSGNLADVKARDARDYISTDARVTKVKVSGSGKRTRDGDKVEFRTLLSAYQKEKAVAYWRARNVELDVDERAAAFEKEYADRTDKNLDYAWRSWYVRDAKHDLAQRT